MRREIDVPTGTVAIEADDSEVEVSFLPSEGNADVAIEGDAVTFRMRKKPVTNSEVTQNGCTFEIVDFRRNGDGYDVLNGNTGVWEKWVED